MRYLGTYANGKPRPEWPDCRSIGRALDDLSREIRNEMHWASESDRADLTRALELLRPVKEAIDSASAEIDRQCEAYEATPSERVS